jgi:hypothetical protein
MAGVFTGIGGCAVGAAAVGADAHAAQAYPANGKLTLTMSEIDPETSKPYQMQMYLTLLDPADPINRPEIRRLEGAVVKGLDAGAQVHAEVWYLPTDTKGNVQTTQALACQDATPGNASITRLLIGDGLSPLGHNASGFSIQWAS